MGKIDVVPVRDRRAQREFLDFPYALYRGDPYWVPPLRIAQIELFDTRKHPFYAHAEMERFLARQDGQTVGRIAAIVDHNYDQFHGVRAGFFGFLEMADFQAVADALLGAARSWLRERGADTLQGPMNPSSNYECGMLVEGFDSSPQVMMTYNPAYYPGLLEQAGLTKAKDLYAYQLQTARADGAKSARVAERAVKARQMTIRPIRAKEFQAEVERLWEVYNGAWSGNWGFVPMTREEFVFSAKDMKSIMEPDLVLVGEVQGRVVGFALALPDINEALKHARGRLFPLGLLKIMYHKRSIRNLRVIALGVIKEFQTAGVAAGFYAALIRNAARLGIEGAEMSWILEDNVLMNRSLEALGARLYKKYRIYQWN